LDPSEQESIMEVQLADEELPAQVNRLEQALMETRRQILGVQRQVNEGLGSEDASIFDAQLLVLEDPTLIEEVSRCIFQEKVSAEYAFQKIAEKYARALSAVDDEYLRERAADMRDVTARMLDTLLGRREKVDLSRLSEPCIIITYDLTPSRTAQMDKNQVLGFGTDIGSKTSHTAIMARSLHIPAVVGLQDVSRDLRTGEYALLDGYNGLIIVNPTDQTLFEYGQLVRKQVTLEERLKDTVDKTAITLDGHRVLLTANIERPEDAHSVEASGADGVGLFRTEYLFISRETLPSEEEQYQAYRTVASGLSPNPVVIRTLDLGGDKLLSHLHVPQEMNPFLGWRAIRFCLQQREIFRDQLRAILRASAEGNVKMMYPMISGLDELHQANALLEEYKAELESEGVPFNPTLEIGAMIEIPSAALAAQDLAKRVKFFSIGTNDLIQYSLAVDRLNDKIAHLYEPTHPAIIRLIKMTVDAARTQNIPVSVCGEMAGDPVLTPLLVGLGVDELSVATPYVPTIKYLIRRMKLEDAKKLAEFALGCESGTDILARSEAYAVKVAPALFDTHISRIEIP
jgi:phosphoenolpyruvate-protein phosphotransferase (PTS system enzyme I)